MPSRSPRGPFRPGTGAAPPYLAGREEGQALFRDLLTDLKQGTAPGTQVVLYGPRGNGKTALLGWLKREAAASGIETSVLRPSEVPSEGRLRELLAPGSWWERIASGEVTIAGFSWKPGTMPPPPPGDILAARARTNALVLLVDEAHTLDLAVGRGLLNAAQEVGAELPFLLVLAGTPNLEGRLNAMGASFWNRAEQIRVGRLSEESTAAAIQRPFADEGIAVAGDALTAIVRESQRYPFFVQLLGSRVWASVTGRGGSRVTLAAVDAALAHFDRTRRRFYRQRLDELRRDGLLKVAVAVAEAFRNRPTLGDLELDAALKAADVGEGDAADTATGRLAKLGFLWRADELPEWEPGIPSLMDYVLRHAPGR